ncbi:MAG: hypothetical protein HZA82_01230 [Thaumarchaeota archaeon]|nr:hypothetical protein [Nitrososphaerota archaeon]
MRKVLCVIAVLLVISVVLPIVVYAESVNDITNSKTKSDNTKSSKLDKYVNKEFENKITKQFTKDKNWTKINSTSVFTTWIKTDDYHTKDGKKIWNKAIFELDPTRNYDKVKSDKKTVVVYPIFTDSAYSEPGFYTYYRNECDTKCLTIKIQNNFSPQANPNAVQVLKLLGYSFITDIDVDKNPQVLAKYDKVIILHNEYVTKKEFNAITAHPNVIYLYPNALYAEVKADYEKNTITLIRGHNYPKSDIRNGFDWKFENSQYEYDTACKKMQFNRIDNGRMLNCYPENIIHKSMRFLETIKKL